MVNELATLVDGEQVIAWLIIAFLVFYFGWSKWPEFKARITASTKKEASSEQQSKEVNDRLSAIERRLASMDDKMQRDYDRLNRFEQELKASRQSDRDSLEERELIMRSLLGIIQGMQEMGADGPTKAAGEKLTDYLNRMAHRANAE